MKTITKRFKNPNSRSGANLTKIPAVSSIPTAIQTPPDQPKIDPVPDEIDPIIHHQKTSDTENDPKPQMPKLDVPVPVIETIQPTVSDESEIDSNLDRKNKKMYGFGLVLTILVIVGTIVFSLASGSFEKSEAPTAVPTSKPTFLPTPKRTFERSKVSIEILNGSGVAGAAGKAAKQLTDVGYLQIQTGNAKSVKGTTLAVQSGYGFYQELKADIEKFFTLASVSADLTDSTYSARLILGK